MKKISQFSITLILMAFVSGCSQTRMPQNNTSQAHQQQRPVVQKAPRYKPRISSQRSHQSRPMVVQPRTPSKSDNNQSRQRIVNIANSTLGTRYRYGGRNPQSGFDCSGLMHYVHKQGLGITIPRTAAQQRDRSRTISYAQLQPGDMLFFKTGKKTNHVGVYIGDRQFIHASTGSRRVRVAKMDSKYWYSRFVKFGTFL